MDKFVNLNGQLLDSAIPLIQTDNKGLVVHQGVFETMRMVRGKIPFIEFHVERMLSGMDYFGLNPKERFSIGFLLEEIGRLCKKNNRCESARIRLQVFRGDTYAEQTSHLPYFMIQSWELDQPEIFFSPAPLSIDVYPYGYKTIDESSRFKTTPFQLYSIATAWAIDHHLGACLVLNQEGRICDANHHNVFCVSNDMIYTPPLSEGCVAGVMRKFLLEKIKESGLNLAERKWYVEDLADAEELFLTNAVRGIQPVHSFRNKLFKTDMTYWLSQQLRLFDDALAMN